MPVLLPLLLRFAAPIAGLVGILVVLWGLASHFESKGKAKAEAKLLPQIQACVTAKTLAEDNARGLQSDLDKLVVANHAREVALQAILDEQRAAQDKGKAEIARLAAKEMGLRQEIGRLAAIAKGPPAPSREVACDGAEQILRDLSVRRAPK
jgi:hypothetical protein